VTGADDMRFSPLNTYSEIEAACRRMLDAAHRDDWDTVASIERSSRVLVASAREHASARLSPVEHVEKFRILTSIVRIDAELRHLAQPWQRNIDRLLAHGAARRPPDATRT